MTGRRRGGFAAVLAPWGAFALLLGLGTACDSSPKFGAFGKAKAVIPVYSDNCNALLGIGGTQGILLDKGFFVVNYWPEWGGPLWTAHCLTPADLKGKASRKGIAFYPEPGLPESLRVYPSDYTGTKIDRGHCVAAADMVRSKEAMRASMSMANIQGQYPALNRNSWRLLEEAIRDSVRIKNRTWIYTGQLVLSGFPKYFGKKHRVVIPDKSFKVVVFLDDQGHYSGFGALGFNDPDRARVDLVSIDSVEALSGFDFNVLLDDSLEERIEAKN